MVRKNFTPEQIINKLREVEIRINQSISVSEVRPLSDSYETTYYYA